ncbi:putative nuclease HARBI1 [Pectinophora gossypiella]|uniref:putative nuclease HARBI1 n=1 Tax=Pectinophora gossypiella TaxID=13191 RepID=UPI00214EDDC0|nr:putative nuclease HARBI1 [Pectinophora gossypiella]
MVGYLHEELEDDLSPINSEGYPADIKILTGLRILVNGHYQRGNGQDQNTSLASTTVSKYLTQFIDAVNRKLKPKWIVFPGSEEARQEVAGGFRQKFGVPNVIGAIDCTHVSLFPPPGLTKIQYKNRHDYMSINIDDCN